MAYEFEKLSEVVTKEEVSDEAMVLVEEDGEIVRVPKKNVGGDATGTLFVDLVYESSEPQ